MNFMLDSEIARFFETAEHPYFPSPSQMELIQAICELPVEIPSTFENWMNNVFLVTRP